MKGLKKLTLVMVLMILACLWVAFKPAQILVQAEEVSETPTLLSGNYVLVKAEWEAMGFSAYSDFTQIITPEAFTGEGLETLAESQGYSHPAYRLADDTPVSFEVSVPGEGLFRLGIDFYSLSDDYLDLELAVQVNGEIPYLESQQILLYKTWHNPDQQFSTDRYGNDFYGAQEQWHRWTYQDFMDPMGLFNDPLVFHLEAGANTITLSKIKGSLLLGDVKITGLKELCTYQDYLADASIVTHDHIAITEAEMPTFKNASSIQAGVSQNVGVTPFSTRILRLNILDGSTYNSERETIHYQVEVPESGYYQITLKALQGSAVNSVVYRTLHINGQVPFLEAKAIPFEYSSKWQNVTLRLPTGDPMLFYLETGTSILSLSVDLSPYQETYYEFQRILKAVNDLSLQIRKLTGNQVDEDRDWDIEEYLPGISDSLNQMADSLEQEQHRIAGMSKTSKLSEVESSLKIAIRNLRFLAQEPNEIPKNITMLATSSSSIASTLGNAVSMILHSPLDLDKIYLHGDVELSDPQGNFFTRFWVAIQRFFLSFFDKRYNDKAAPDELEVWINRPKQYVDLIQKMADEQFTPASGIKVKASVMAAEGKLILANSAGKNPDVAMGVASWLPYDLGIRGAILDLSQYASDIGFKETLTLYPEQSLIPLMFDNGLYGLPDTENFYVLFYRTDILSALDIQVPDTWEDVVDILPILKRYGLNFYITLSSSSSLKSFDSTLPFLFQYGSDIYREDSFAVNLDNEDTVNALTMMTELYTIYSMDVQVSSFYNDFRLGLSPIGVGDFGMYVTLLNAAPDIQGLWSIAPLPGVLKGDVVDRSAPGAQTANMVFKNSDKTDESWEFLKWWSSTSVQTQFSSLLLSTMGKEYLFNSANMEAFRNLNLATEDIDIILAQWNWLKELPKVPGSYQVELEISNLWNSVVLDRANLRVGLNDGIIKMNKEIVKKMAEFSYMTPDGTILKPYVAASVAQIKEWTMSEEDEFNG